MKRLIYASWLLLILAGVANAQTPGVQLHVVSTTFEPGEIVLAQLICTNIGEPSLPEAALPDGLKLELSRSAPMMNSQTSIINGRTSSKTTYTYNMRLSATSEGTYTVGPMSVEADGQSFVSNTVTITVKKSTATQPQGDSYAWAHIDVEPTVLYASQSFTATLTLGIRRVVINNRMIDINMLRNVVDQRGSQFSVFVSGSKLTTSQKRLTDSSGQTHMYEIIRLTKIIRADDVGEMLVGPVFIKINYPTRLRRGFFGRQEVASTRRESVHVEAVSVEVKTPPQQGRPDSFVGAIGHYSLAVSAKPLRVEQGQPVTLTIKISGSPIAGVAGPNLAAQPELLSRFEFTSDELVGDIERGAMVYRRAIFPKQVGEQTIPPLTWSYFDTTSESYQTLTSKPISIVVDPSTSTGHVITLSPNAASDDQQTSLTLLTGGISPNYIDATDVLADQTITISPTLGFALAFPPIFWLIIALATSRIRRMRGDLGWARRQKARRQANVAIRVALSQKEPSAQLLGLSEALTGFVSDRINLPPGTLTPQDVRMHLGSRGLDERQLNDITEFLEQCDSARYAMSESNAHSPQQLATSLREWLTQIERVTR